MTLLEKRKLARLRLRILAPPVSAEASLEPMRALCQNQRCASPGASWTMRKPDPCAPVRLSGIKTWIPVSAVKEALDYPDLDDPGCFFGVPRGRS